MNTAPSNPANGKPGGRLFALVPGLFASALVAAISVWLAKLPTVSAYGISALTVAIVIGMVIGNTFYSRIAATCKPGIEFSTKRVLRLGIILYGLRLTFQDVADVGVVGILIDVVVVAGIFCLSWYAGMRIFKLDRETSMLIGSGASICGAAAVLAVEPVVKGRPEQVTIAVATVVLFGTIAMFLYPAIWEINQRLGMFQISAAAFGIYIGSTVHEVAQVVAAGSAVDMAAADTAVITKMVRVMLMAPFLIVLSALLGRSRSPASGSVRPPLVVPWFAVMFIVVVAINSTFILPPQAVSAAIEFDTFILSMAMGALGMTTSFAGFRKAGIRPLYLAAFLFAWLVIGGALLNAGVMAVL